MSSHEWLEPLLRALTGMAVLIALVSGARWHIGREGDRREPFDSGLD